MTVDYETIAVRYGTMLGTRAETFYRYGTYGEADGPLQLDYFFWVVRDGNETTLVDSGFSAEAGLRRNRTQLVDPKAALERLSIDPDSVSNIVVSHFHYDHIGNLSSFPHATLHLQEKEFAFWTSPIAERAQFRFLYETLEIDHIKSAMAEGRVQTLSGDATIAPGISLELVGGHCPGQQIITIDGPKRPIVLATDALHLYEELEKDMPFWAFTDLPDTYLAFERLRALEAEGGVVVAGHDPLVLGRFERFGEGSGVDAARID